MNRPPYSIRFPLITERTRVGRKVFKRLKVDQTGLHGARFCAAGMVSSALLYRDAAPSQFPERAALYLRINRLGMRQSALWARLFAGQIKDNDPRLAAVDAERGELVRLLQRDPIAA
jgi:hypothetical protein